MPLACDPPGVEPPDPRDISEQEKGQGERLPRLRKPCIYAGMKRFFDMDDRARLRERFFGATLTVLARLS